MCSCLDPMAQRIPMQDESLPRVDPEPGMGAAAAEAAVHDTSPPPLYQNPPILAESAQPGTFDMAQLVAILAGMRGETREMMQGMNEKMDGMSKKNGWHGTDSAG